MAGTVETEYDALVKALNESKYTKEEATQILSEYMNAILSNECIASDRRSAASMITGDFIKRVRQYEWKFAHGFFGNWAKHHEESVIDEIDDHYSGC